MPFINTKVSIPLTEAQKDSLKTKLGKAIELIPGKSEKWLMVGFEDEYCLYFQGNDYEPSAFIEVKIFGNAPDSAYERLTMKLCEIYETELHIPQDRIYIKYEEVTNWGWNGANF